MLSGCWDEVTETCHRILQSTKLLQVDSWCQQAPADVISLGVMRYEHRCLFVFMIRPKFYAFFHIRISTIVSPQNPPFVVGSLTCLIHHMVDFFCSSRLMLKKPVCVFLWCFMIYACIKWIFVYFFWCFNASLLLTCSLFSRPEPASSSLNIKTHHSSQLHTALGWALNTHRINIPSTVCDAVQILRPTFMTHRVVFSDFFSPSWRARCWWCFVLIANGTIAQYWRNLI